MATHSPSAGWVCQLNSLHPWVPVSGRAAWHCPPAASEMCAVFPAISRLAALQLGAQCSREVGPHITHVVSRATGSDKVRWAARHRAAVVAPEWLVAAGEHSLSSETSCVCLLAPWMHCRIRLATSPSASAGLVTCQCLCRLSVAAFARGQLPRAGSQCALQCAA